jgi:MFS family permease
MIREAATQAKVVIAHRIRKMVGFRLYPHGGRLHQRASLWSIYVSVGISYLGVGLVAPLISLVLYQHGANSFLVGLVGTTMFLAFTVAAFPIGTLTDRIGTKPILIAGLLVYGLAILMFAFIRDTWLFFVVRTIEGIGGAAISVATETMINHLSPPNQRSQRMGYYAISVAGGWALGPLVGTSLFAVHPEAPFIAGFVFSAAAAAMVVSYAPTSISPDHTAKGLFSVLSAKMAIPVSAGCLYGYLMSSLVTLFPLYLKIRGIKDVVMGTIISAVVIGTVLSQLPIGKAADRFGKRVVLLVCGIALTGLFIAFTQRPDWWYLVIIGVLIGAAAGSLYPLGLAMVGEITKGERLGAATALFSLAFGMGSLIGPSISGLAMNRFGYDTLFYVPAALTAIFSIAITAIDGKSFS